MVINGQGRVPVDDFQLGLVQVTFRLVSGSMESGFVAEVAIVD